MNEVKGFSFYRSYYDCLKELDAQTRNELLNAILEYIFEDKAPNFKGLKKTLWLLIEPNLRTSKKHSNKKSGAPFGNQNAKKEEKRRKLNE